MSAGHPEDPQVTATPPSEGRACSSRPGIQRSFSQHRATTHHFPPETLHFNDSQTHRGESNKNSSSSEDNGGSSPSLGDPSPVSSLDSSLYPDSTAYATYRSPASSQGQPTARVEATTGAAAAAFCRGQKPTVATTKGAHLASSLMSAPPMSSNFDVSPPLHSPCYVHSHLTATAAASASASSSSAGPASSSHYPFSSSYPHSASPFQTKHSKKRGDASTPPMHPTTSRNLAKSPQADTEDAVVRTPRMLHRQAEQQVHKPQYRQSEGSDDASDGSMTEEGEDDEASTLTRRLAETATSVREMSKQLGRARVKSGINSILIITKARDNHLIKLTRELAIWIMTEMRPPSSKERGVICYVDAQLQRSKRFDAAGIERDYPHLFRPLVRRFSRRSSLSRTNSSNLPDIKRTHSEFVHKIGPLSTAEPGRSGSASVPTGSPKISPPPSAASSEPETGTAKDDGQKGQLRYWTSEMCQNSPHLFDFVITLGGDGTVLFASWLFQRIVPPIIPFALGSLGFLTNFDYLNYKKTLQSILQDGVRINLRMRFSCTVYRAVEPAASRRRAVRSGQTGEIYMSDLASGGWDSIESGGMYTSNSKRDKEVLCFTTKPAEQFEVINDLVVDRGPSPYVSLLELFGDEHHMTTVQADGLCVATPTGSTAYSLSAGGSLVHPESPAILVSPICPHTLSFRPIILPDSMELRICVPYNSRSTAWASFDGRGRVELRQGDHIKITASPYPFPTVCKDKQSTDWFSSIARTLKWNERQRQKSFVVVEEDRAEPGEKNADAANNPDQKLAGSVENEAQLDDDEEADEQFDIDEISSTENSTPASPQDPSAAAAAATKTKQSRPTQTVLSQYSGSEIELESEESGRFKDPAPRPPPVSRRHTYEDPMAQELSRPLEVHLPPVSRQRKQSYRSRPPLSSSSLAGPPSFGPNTNNLKAPGDQLSHRKSTSSQRAFAVFGDDESDASLSESDASEAM